MPDSCTRAQYAIWRDIRRHSSDSWKSERDDVNGQIWFHYKDIEEHWAFRLMACNVPDVVEITFKPGLFDEDDFLDDDTMPRRYDADGRRLRVLRMGATVAQIKVEVVTGFYVCEIPTRLYWSNLWTRLKARSLLVFAQRRLLHRLV